MSIPIINTEHNSKSIQYIIVSKNWQRIVMFILIIITIAVVFLVYTLSLMNFALRKEITQTEIWKQRVGAMNDLLKNRAMVQQFSYDEACKSVKSRGEKCLENPTWWADPDKYPLLVNDPSGDGLFNHDK